jgi:hypothetical protein
VCAGLDVHEDSIDSRQPKPAAKARFGMWAASAANSCRWTKALRKVIAVKTDRRDARMLARLARAGESSGRACPMLPTKPCATCERRRGLTTKTNAEEAHHHRFAPDAAWGPRRSRGHPQ